MNLARTAGAVYVVAIACGFWALYTPSAWRAQASLAAALSYVVVTLLFYPLFKPVHARVSILAALVSLAGCAISMAGTTWLRVNPLPIFGIYCLLLAWLVARSTLPRALAILLAVGGLGWLTFASPSLTRVLQPYNLVPGILGETLLTLWLLVAGPTVVRRPATSTSR